MSIVNEVFSGVDKVYPKSNPPEIIEQPVDTTSVNAGVASFSCNATGDTVLTWVWYLNDVVIPGADNIVYTTEVNDYLVNNGDIYHCVVTDTLGQSVTSDDALLTVSLPIAPTITIAPVDPSVIVGAVINFVATASGYGTLAYQWRLNGNVISGATSATYDRTTVIEDDGKVIACKVTDAAGTVTVSADSAMAVALPAAPTITIAPLAPSVIEGATINFTSVSAGSGALTYQWFHEGISISGATADFYNRPTVLSDNGTAVTCTVTDGYGQAVTSAPATMAIEAAYRNPVYVGNKRIASNTIPHSFTPTGLNVGGIIVATMNQRTAGNKDPSMTGGVTVLETFRSNERTVQIAEYTGGAITIEYGTGTDAQFCGWYFNDATLGRIASSTTYDGAAVECDAETYVLNLYAWAQTRNADPRSTTDWGLNLPGKLTWPNCCGMCKLVPTAGSQNPGPWSNSNGGAGVNRTIEIKGIQP